jgi:hypothetical protein
MRYEGRGKKEGWGCEETQRNVDSKGVVELDLGCPWL